MRTVPLTEGGPQVSVLGLGCNAFGRNIFGWFDEYSKCERVVHAALSEGYTFFDTADRYGFGDSEEYLGRALAGRRDRVMVATKFGAPMPDGPDTPVGSADYIRWAIGNSLRRLRTDYVDLYQIHVADLGVPIAETLGVLQELVDEGKIRYIGASGFPAALLDEAARCAAEGAGPRLATCMMHYSLLTRECETEIIPTCVRLGMGVLPWFALEHGILTGKYQRASNDATDAPDRQRIKLAAEVWDAIAGLERFAADHGISLLELAIGGLAAMPGVSALPVGATSPEQVASNVRAVAWTPSAEELEALRALSWSSPGGSEWLRELRPPEFQQSQVARSAS
jgi:aryl-alcohol dehydrogenase-like predicted oxidoreductase